MLALPVKLATDLSCSRYLLS